MQGETAFIVVKRDDGSFFAYTDFGLELDINRLASRNDIKSGCREIFELIDSDDLANLVISKFPQAPAPESERTASSIRQALSDKGIL
jgi:hypothetical protein